MRVIIIDCGAGNLHSVAAGFRRASCEIDVTIEISTDAAALATADAVVLPGVGAFADCMRGLEALPGMRAALETEVLEAKKPFLGICVGMQMLLEQSHEHGDHKGLGWIEGEVIPIEPTKEALRIPHMGWNDLVIRPPGHPLFDGINSGDHMYFVHSYHAHCQTDSDVLATVDYGGSLCAALGRENILGVQFHPEKSQRVGERLLRNFMRMG